MSFRINYVNEINDFLMEKRMEGDVQITLTIPEHEFKKTSEKFNYAIKSVYEKHIDSGIKMFHIILSLHNYFDMHWLIKNILDNSNKKIITEEMKTEYNIKLPICKKKKNKNKKNKNKKKKNGSRKKK